MYWGQLGKDCGDGEEMDTGEKDHWDKLEILGKVALPVVVAGATIWFNSEVSTRQQTAEMVKVAVGVLGQEGKEENDPLRGWAVGILRQQGGLSEDAANALVNDPRLTIELSSPSTSNEVSDQALPLEVLKVALSGGVQVPVRTKRGIEGGNLRAGPSLAHRIVEFVPPAFELYAVSVEGFWVRVVPQDDTVSFTGWMHHSLLQF